MRTRFTALTLAAASLVGCATNPRVQGVAPEAPSPLQVWVGFPIGSSQVYPIFTNREAHVALFEIIPGRGVTMVYPFHRGHHVASDAHYADLARQPGRMFYYTDPFGHASYQPRYYYAVASAAPLNLAPLQTSLGATRRVLGRSYASYRPYDVIDQLTTLVVPMQPDEQWATDLFVDWPVPPSLPVFASSRIVRCANGRVFRVASNYPYYGCPGDAESSVIASAPQAPQPGTVEAPRAPRNGGKRDGVELSNGVDKRRRAQPGARVPSADVAAWAPRKGVRHAERESGHSPARSPRGTWSAGSAEKPASAGRSSAERTERAERSQTAEPSGSSRSAPGGESSGKEKKPQE